MTLFGSHAPNGWRGSFHSPLALPTPRSSESLNPYPDLLSHRSYVQYYPSTPLYLSIPVVPTTATHTQFQTPRSSRTTTAYGGIRAHSAPSILTSSNVSVSVLPNGRIPPPGYNPPLSNPGCRPPQSLGMTPRNVDKIDHQNRPQPPPMDIQVASDEELVAHVSIPSPTIALDLNRLHVPPEKTRRSSKSVPKTAARRSSKSEKLPQKSSLKSTAPRTTKAGPRSATPPKKKAVVQSQKDSPAAKPVPPPIVPALSLNLSLSGESPYKYVRSVTDSCGSTRSTVDAGGLDDADQDQGSVLGSPFGSIRKAHFANDVFDNEEFFRLNRNKRSDSCLSVHDHGGMFEALRGARRDSIMVETFVDFGSFTFGAPALVY